MTLTKTITFEEAISLAQELGTLDNPTLYPPHKITREQEVRNAEIKEIFYATGLFKMMVEMDEYDFNNREQFLDHLVFNMKHEFASKVLVNYQLNAAV